MSASPANLTVPSPLAPAINGERLWQRHFELAKFGERPDGGVNRQALSKDDIEARNQIIAWAKPLGFKCATDPMANLFVRKEGLNPSLPPLLIGSHLDSQPAGGKFDGAYGVLAALEVLTAMSETGLETECPVELVAWTNEEGSRFAPGISGSSAFAGLMPIDRLKAGCDADGVTLNEALTAVLAASPELELRPLGFPVAAYIEAHIEQGPVLQQEGCHVGIVTGIQGARWFNVDVVGRSEHAGTVPMSMRRDALKSMMSIVAALTDLTVDETDTLRFTVGRVVVEPNSPNTVPGTVQFSIDLRHPDSTTLTDIGDKFAAICKDHANGCDVSIEETLSMPPAIFDTRLVDLISAAANDLELKSMSLASGAFHDASAMNAVCPTGMIFVPCEGGLSHNPNENTDPADLAAGAQLLASVVETCSKTDTFAT